MPKPPPDADSIQKELENLVRASTIYRLKLFNIIYIFVQLEATVPLQEVGGGDNEESVIMSTAKVYHIKMDSDGLDECGAEKTKCWTGK